MSIDNIFNIENTIQTNPGFIQYLSDCVMRNAYEESQHVESYVSDFKYWYDNLSLSDKLIVNKKYNTSFQFSHIDDLYGHLQMALDELTRALLHNTYVCSIQSKCDSTNDLTDKVLNHDDILIDIIEKNLLYTLAIREDNYNKLIERYPSVVKYFKQRMQFTFIVTYLEFTYRNCNHWKSVTAKEIDNGLLLEMINTFEINTQNLHILQNLGDDFYIRQCYEFYPELEEAYQNRINAIDILNEFVESNYLS